TNPLSYYAVETVAGDGAAYYRGNRGVTDHWNVFIVAPNVNDKEADGTWNNTSGDINAATYINIYAANDIFGVTDPWKPDGTDESLWHASYWRGVEAWGTGIGLPNNGAPRAAKNDYASTA